MFFCSGLVFYLLLGWFSVALCREEFLALCVSTPDFQGSAAVFYGGGVSRVISRRHPPKTREKISCVNVPTSLVGVLII